MKWQYIDRECYLDLEQSYLACVLILGNVIKYFLNNVNSEFFLFFEGKPVGNYLINEEKKSYKLLS